MKSLFLTAMAFLSLSSFAQGYYTVSKEDTDILIVVDNSGSMQQWQTRFSDLVPAIFEKYKNNSIRIGLVSTDEVQVPLFYGQQLSDTFNNVLLNLRKQINRIGTGGDPTERPLKQVMRTFADPDQINFHRSMDTQLEVYIVTDEEDQSEGYEQGIGFLSDLIQFKDLKKVRIHLYAPMSNCSTNNVDPNQNLALLSKTTGGTQVDLCLE